MLSPIGFRMLKNLLVQTHAWKSHIELAAK